jgi:hypothetical protein
VKEAAEQVFSMIAVGSYLENRRKRIEEQRTRELDDDEQKTTRYGDDAKALADKPHLTGDPEWDAIELAETDPTRPTLQERGIA